MTVEQLEYLRQFEGKFITAIKSNYTRSIPKKDLDKMLEIYNSITNKKITLCYHCTASIVGLLRDLGNLYLKEVTEQSVGTVQEGLEQELNINELEKSVTVTERSDVANRKNSVGTEMERTNTKNNTTKNTKNGKHKPKQSK